MTITDLVAPEAILPALKVISKKQALQELALRELAPAMRWSRSPHKSGPGPKPASRLSFLSPRF